MIAHIQEALPFAFAHIAVTSLVTTLSQKQALGSVEKRPVLATLLVPAGKNYVNFN